MTINEIESQLEYVKLIEIEGKGELNSSHKDAIIKLCNEYDRFRNTPRYNPLLTESIKKFVLKIDEQSEAIPT